MKDEKIIIGGEIYISSRRAGKEFGYTSDYVGFLAREGKVKTRIVGRARFVSQKSLASYKFSSKNENFQIRRLEYSIGQNLAKAKIGPVLGNFNIVRSLVLAAILISLILPPLVSNLADYVFSFDPGSVIGRQPYAQTDNPPAGRAGFNNGKFLVASVQSSIQDTISKIKNESVKLDDKLFDFLNFTSGQITAFFDFLGSKVTQDRKSVV